mgnify:CR=1 FL=1|tara:strand:- start:275 stop:592 length:318 start_codon:yes stop_codon:yes gene_type:complete
MRKLKIDELDNVNLSGYKVGELKHFTYKQIKKALGKPTFKPRNSGDFKVQYEWVVLYGDKVFRVYDWKTYDKEYTKKILTTWSIGGHTSCDWFLQTLVNKIQAND